MIGLLAIIGLIFILWFLSKGLKKISNFLINLGDAMIDYSESVKRSSRHSNTDELRNKIKSIREPDDNFNDKVKREIDELTNTGG